MNVIPQHFVEFLDFKDGNIRFLLGAALAGNCTSSMNTAGGSTLQLLLFSAAVTIITYKTMLKYYLTQ